MAFQVFSEQDLRRDFEHPEGSLGFWATIDDIRVAESAASAGHMQTALHVSTPSSPILKFLMLSPLSLTILFINRMIKQGDPSQPWTFFSSQVTPL